MRNFARLTGGRGAVSVIGKLRLLLEAFERLNEKWRDRPDKQHPLLSTPIVVPILVEGGEFFAMYPSGSVLSFDTTYMLRYAGEEGFGSSVRSKVESFVNRYPASDLWLCERPPRW
jgi:acetylornithine deacetylase